jgi:hypothetical protein
MEMQMYVCQDSYVCGCLAQAQQFMPHRACNSLLCSIELAHKIFSIRSIELAHKISIFAYLNMKILFILLMKCKQSN